MTTPLAGRRVVAPRERRGEGGWYGLLAPPAAWVLQEWLGWYFGQRTCSGLAPASVRWILLGVSIAAFAVTLLGVRLGWGTWRDEPGGDHRDRVDFIAFGGFLVSSIFAIAILWGGLATAFLGDCGWIR